MPRSGLWRVSPSTVSRVWGSVELWRAGLAQRPATSQATRGQDCITPSELRSALGVSEVAGRQALRRLAARGIGPRSCSR